MRTVDSAEQVEALLSSYDTWLFDCDGVIWAGEDVLDGSVEFLRLLKSRGKRTIFITNNSSKSRKENAKRFSSHGYEVPESDVFTSGYGVAQYLKLHAKLEPTKKVFMIGHGGFADEVRAAGYDVIGADDPDFCRDTEADDLKKKIRRDPTIGAVVIGFDQKMSYLKICWAHVQLEDPDCLFVLANIDSTYPAADKVLLPGAGSLAQVLIHSSGREPVRLGKPSPLFLEIIRETVHFEPERTIMVGDRLNTDIALGKTGGLGTLLVLSGVTKCTSEVTSEASSDVTVPDFVAPRLGAILEKLL